MRTLHELALPVDILREARSAAVSTIGHYRRKLKKMSDTQDWKYVKTQQKIARLELFLSAIEAQVGDIKRGGDSDL